MGQPNEFCHIGNFAQRIGQFIENTDHFAIAMRPDRFGNQLIGVSDDILLQNVEALRASQFGDIEETLLM